MRVLIPEYVLNKKIAPAKAGAIFYSAVGDQNL